MYTVKEVSQKLELSQHAVRFYTDNGLLPSVQRDKNNIRLFDQRAVNGLNMIKCLKHSGMSIKDIKRYVDLCALGDSTIPKRYEIIHAQKQVAAAQLEEAKKRLEYLEVKEEKYRGLMEKQQKTKE